MVNKTMDLVLGNPIRFETISEQNMLYVMMDWYPAPDSIDKFHFVNEQDLLQVPVDCQQYSATLTTFKASIEGVSSMQYSFRCAINPTDANGIPKPLCSLQTKNSINEYAKVFILLVSFVKNRIERGPQDLKAAEMLDVLVQEAFQAPSRNTIFPLILALMESNVANSHSTSPIPLFLRFLCLKSDGSLLQPEEIGSNCAKLQYLMKLTVLESVVSNQLWMSRCSI